MIVQNLDTKMINKGFNNCILKIAFNEIISLSNIR